MEMPWERAKAAGGRLSSFLFEETEHYRGTTYGSLIKASRKVNLWEKQRPMKKQRELISLEPLHFGRGALSLRLLSTFPPYLLLAGAAVHRLFADRRSFLLSWTRYDHRGDMLYLAGLGCMRAPRPVHENAFDN